jgi:hypothetical protein
LSSAFNFEAAAAFVIVPPPDREDDEARIARSLVPVKR